MSAQVEAAYAQMAQHMQESGVAPCLINVSVKKEALPRGFFFLYIQIFIILVPLSSSIIWDPAKGLFMYIRTTQDNRDQAMRKFPL